ncbi:MAG: sulfatase family protein [Planctomycetota bacterium]
MPNLVFVFADQWRAQALGCAGDPNVRTPFIDRLARDSVAFDHMVCHMPVCTPYRGTLMTGMFPHRHGLFLNDLCLYNNLRAREPAAVTLGEAFRAAGYATGYIGKWHIDGHGRAGTIPPERRLGFDHWQVLECSHDYNASRYYAGADTQLRRWPGYDADAQTDAAIAWLQTRPADPRPFFLALSWGPPHNPYDTAPERFRALYDPAAIQLRPNVPTDRADQADRGDRARRELAGYYAHCSALDADLERLSDALAAAGLADDTIFIFTSDHGDMLHSQGQERKQRPWDESILAPLFVRLPAARFPTAARARREAQPISSVDLMPTLCGLCGVPVPASVQGRDCSRLLTHADRRGQPAGRLIANYSPFGEFERRHGGREFRGVRTARYTYVRDLTGPWLLYDNQTDPFQLQNLVGRPEALAVQAMLEQELHARLSEADDRFYPGATYLQSWNYAVDEGGSMSWND